jgi:hypothetical protein
MPVNISDPCHEQVLAAANDIIARKGVNEFTPDEVVQELNRARSKCSDSTIRTHVVSRCCGNAPNHHAVVYDYFARIGPGLYRVR